MTNSHLVILQVVIPLLAAPICALLRDARVGWCFSFFTGLVCFACSIGLLLLFYSQGEQSYFLGGWAAPWGIEYRVDALNCLVLLVLCGVNVLALAFARLSAEDEIESHQSRWFYTAWLLCFTGLLGITITGDVFNVFVFLEISSLSGYVLISLGRDPRAITSAFQYLIIGTIGATFILIGVGLLYAMTGSLNMADLATILPAVANTSTVHAAAAFFAVGIAIKMALFPLHAWLPNAYTYSPSVVTVFFAGTATKVAVYILLRFFFTIFGAKLSIDVLSLDKILLPLALAGIFAASIIAAYQADAKKLLAWSSVAQIGYMILGVGIGTAAGMSAGILHIFNHALIKTALFMAMGCVAYQIGSTHISGMRGLGKHMPWTMAAFVAAGLSLIGVPLTAGFISKWYLITAALDNGLWWLALLVLISSLIAVVYIWRVVECAYFQESDNEGEIKEAPLSLLAPMWLLVVANFYFGIDASFTTGLATEAAEALWNK